MDKLDWIYLAKVFAVASGIVGGLFALYRYVDEKREKRRLEKKADDEKHLSATSEVEIKRIEIDQRFREYAHDQLVKIVENREREISDLRQSLVKLSENEKSTLYLYVTMARGLREIMEHLHDLEMLVFQKSDENNLHQQIDAVRDAIDKLEFSITPNLGKANAEQIAQITKEN